jgi:hypothetical protein
MKYLKPFNEAVSEDTIELCCVDLYDYGFELKGFSKPGEPTVISLTKSITSDMPEWDGIQGTDVRGDIMWDEHLSKYQPGNITKGSITIRQQQEWINFSYEKFMRVVDKWYENDDEIRYIEIILDNE